MHNLNILFFRAGLEQSFSEHQKHPYPMFRKTNLIFSCFGSFFQYFEIILEWLQEYLPPQVWQG